MLDFTYYNPTKILFGRKAYKNVGKEINHLGKKRVMIMYDGPYIIERGILEMIHQSLDAVNVSYFDVSGVMPNPLLSYVYDQIKLGKENNADFVLAIGGGSVIDAAKAVAAGIANDFDIKGLFLGDKELSKTIDVGVVSTIAGSGSESSCSMIITLDEGMLKRPYDSDLIRPKFAVLDPEVTFTVPHYQLVSGGVDILMHTMERYFSKTQNTNLIDSMSEGLLVSTMLNLKKSILNPKDYDARANLMWAGNLSHNGLTETGKESDWACHRMEHELSGLFDVVHGAGLCALWGSWARYVYQEDVSRFAQFAVNVMGIQNNFHNQKETAIQGIRAMEAFFSSVGMPTSLRDLGLELSNDEKEKMADNCLINSEGTIGKFKVLNRDDILNIYTNAA